MTQTTKATATPGPWCVEDGVDIWQQRSGDHESFGHGYHIARLYFVGERAERDDGNYDFPQMDANARLIAAAPALLEAAEAALRDDDGAGWKLRAAIAAAKGEQLDITELDPESDEYEARMGLVNALFG